MSALRTTLPLAVLGLVGLVACTAIVTADAVQCSTDADCEKRGPDFTDTLCSVEGFCIAKPPPAAAPPECTKNSDCAAKGAGMVCSGVSNLCAPVTSEDCKVVYGDPTVDGTMLFGLLSEVGRDDTLYFRQQQHLTAAKLAFLEFFEKAGARFPGNRGGALIACSEHFPRRAAAHLANLGVKVVIGPSNEERQLAVVETLLQAHISSFSPWINGNPASVLPGAGGYAWLAGFQRSDVTAPLNALLAEKERQAKAAGKSNIRVAVIVSKTTPPAFNAFAEYGDFMDQRLRFNDKSAIENQSDLGCGGCYKRFETNQAPKAVVDERATAIAAFQPDFIIPFADIDWGAQLLPKLEEKFKDLPANKKPTYIQPFLQIEDAGYRGLPVDTPDVRKRITGIRPVRDNSFEIFSTKFRETFPSLNDPTKNGPDPNPGAGRAFETTLLFLLTTYAALQEKAGADVTPEEVVAALRRTTDGTGPKITLTDIRIAVAELNRASSVNFDGLFTFFDLDQNTHTAPATWTTWCVGPQGQYTSGARVFKNNAFTGGAEVCP